MKKYKSKDSLNLRKLITHRRRNLCNQINERIMKNTFVKADFNVHAFSASRIIFDDSDLVSMDIRCRVNETLMTTTLLFTFSRFNDLLRFSGEAGDTLQMMVSDKLLSNEEQPYIIDLQQSPIVFTSCMLELAYLIAEDDSCFSVEELHPISFLQQARMLRKNMRDFRTVQLANQVTPFQPLHEFATRYRYYKGLLELNLSEAAAREKAGLLNDKLFKMAYHAANQVNM